MICSSIGSFSNDGPRCKIGRIDIVEDDSCTAEAGSDAFDMVGCDSAIGGGKASCTSDDGRSRGELINQAKNGCVV